MIRLDSMKWSQAVSVGTHQGRKTRNGCVIWEVCVLEQQQKDKGGERQWALRNYRSRKQLIRDTYTINRPVLSRDPCPHRDAHGVILNIR